MPLSVAISQGFGAATARGNKPMNYVATVTNTGSSPLSLSSLSVIETSPASSVQITQPVFLTPNVPVGVGNPVIPAGEARSYPFQVIFNAPNTAGEAAQAPGGGMNAGSAMPADPFYVLQANCQDSNGAITVGSIFVPVLSAVNGFPIPQGGAMDFRFGLDAANWFFFS